MTTLEKVKQVLKEQLGLKDDQIQEDSKLVEDLRADSLDQVEIVMTLEELFETDIPDEEAEKLNTPKEVAEYIDKHC